MTFLDKTQSFSYDYYLARTLFGFSEEEFWKSSPRTLRTLQCFYLLYSGKAFIKPTKEQISARNKQQLNDLGIILSSKGKNY